MTVTVRKARVDDIAVIVAMLGDDELGAARETPDDLAPYQQAFAVIDADPHQVLVVAEDEGDIVGTLQLTLIPGLSRTAATRGQIEAVRVHSNGRAGGVGTLLMEWAIGEAKSRGCQLVQLTSDAARSRAHGFYERLGFVASHVGFKLEV